MKSDGVAVGDGSKLPLIRQKSKIFATFPPGGRLYGGVKSDGVAGGDGLELPLIRQKSKIFATFPPRGRLGGGEVITSSVFKNVLSGLF